MVWSPRASDRQPPAKLGRSKHMSPVHWLRLHWDRVAGWCAMVAGAISLVAGWMGASATPYPAAQLPHLLSGGLGGLFLLGLGGILLLSADLRDEWRKLDGIEEALLRSAEHHMRQAPGLGTNGTRPTPANGEADTAEGLTTIPYLGS